MDLNHSEKQLFHLPVRTVNNPDNSCTINCFKQEKQKNYWNGEIKTMKSLLMKALKNTFNMAKEDAVALTKTVEEIFDGRKEIEDQDIDKYARALFYELQRENLLKIRREETREEGRYIRRYYWTFNKKIIKQQAYKKPKEEDFGIYKKIPHKAWVTHSRYGS
jgi:hypothetical protein